MAVKWQAVTESLLIFTVNPAARKLAEAVELASGSTKGQEHLVSTLAVGGT